MMRVNEIFYSLQGEGRFTGNAAVFVRLSGCNMKCPFCDTDHYGFTEMSEDEIVNEICKYPARHVVITGGEPAMQLTMSMTSKLHDAGFFIQMETNGTIPLAEGCKIDWTTCSPKDGGKLAIQHIDELKVLYHKDGIHSDDDFESVKAQVYSLQPLDTNDKKNNDIILNDTIEYILKHPKWRLSLQTHKMIGVR